MKRNCSDVLAEYGTHGIYGILMHLKGVSCSKDICTVLRVMVSNRNGVFFDGIFYALFLD